MLSLPTQKNSTQSASLPLLSWQTDSLYCRFFKRWCDVAFSLSVLVLLSPLFLAIYIGIRLSSDGKVIYTQERLGINGKVFRCLKFRTMVPGADASLERILDRFPKLKKEWEQKQKLRRDPRVFSFGKFLRKTSLDELPQFWNVLKGDLSVVGPRPYILAQSDDLGMRARKILSIRPGITGLWQTSGRSRTSFQQRISLDAAYVDRQSFWFDVYLIIKTIPVVLCFKDAC